MSQIKKGAVLSYVNLGITNVVGIALTPYIIGKLGDSEYGLYTLIGSFVGYLSVLDLGLNNAIVRFVAQYRAENNKKGEENFVAVSLLIYSLIGLLIGFMGMMMYLNLDNLFGDTLDAQQLDKAKMMLLILIFNIAFTLPGGAFTGICTGYEEFVFPRLLSISKYVLRSLLVVIILKFGTDALGLVVLDTVMNLCFIVASAIFVFKKLQVNIKLHEFNVSFIKEIFGYSIWIFLFGLIYQFQWRTGQVILGTNTSTITVAVYGVGVMLGVYFTTFGNVINRLILPKAVKNVYQEMDAEGLTTQMIKVARISLVLLLYIFGGFLLLGQEFIHLWVGDVYQDSWLIAVLIMIVYIMPISQGYAHAILEAKKMLRFKTLSFLIASLVGTLIGGLLSFEYGAKGMILGIFIPLLVLQWVIMNIFYKKKLQINILEFFKKILTIVAVFVLTETLCYGIFYFVGDSWLLFVVKGSVYSFIFCLTTYFVMNEDEKKLFSSKLF